MWVEDDCDILDACAELLRLDGHDVTTAISVEQARALLATRSFDALITDYNLGAGPTGEDLLVFAANEFPAPWRILYSASDFRGLPGANEIVSKHSGVANLLGAVRNLERADASGQAHPASRGSRKIR